MPNPPHSEAIKNQTIALYLGGNSVHKVSKITNVPRRTVQRWVDKLNAHSRPAEKPDHSGIKSIIEGSNKLAITSYFDGTSIDEKALGEFCKLANEGYTLLVVPITVRSSSFKTKPTGKLPELPANVHWATDKLLDLYDNTILINNSGYRQRVTHFKNVNRSVVVPHHSFSLVSTPNVFSEDVYYVVTTGSLSRRSNYSQNHQGMVMSNQHKLGCILIDKSEGTLIQRDLLDDTQPQTLVMGDVHLPFKSQEEYDRFEAKLVGYLAKYNPREVVFHDYVDFGFASHHLYNSDVRQLDDRSEGRLNKVVESLLSQHSSILTVLSTNNVKMRVVYSNHDSHYIKGLLSLSPKQLVNVTEQYLYYSLALEFLRNRDKNPIEAFFDVLVALYTPESIENYKKHLSKVDFQFLSVYNNKQVAGYYLGLHGDHGINGSRFSPEAISNLGVKLVVGHAHTASRFNDVLTVGTSSPMDMGYNAKGLSSWSSCNVILTEKSAYHAINLKHNFPTTFLETRIMEE